MGDDEWTVVAKGSRRKMSSTAFRALQVRAEHESGPAEDPPDASVDKTWSQIERAVREIRDAPFTKTLLRRMEDAGFVPNDAPAKPGERRAPSPGRRAENADAPASSVARLDAASEDEFDASSSELCRNVSRDADAENEKTLRGVPLRFARMVILGLGSPTRSAVSRFQLGLALVLAERLAIGGDDVRMYDPAFSPVDVATLRNKNVGVVLDRAAANALCGPDAARAREATFWYMPHCEAALYENVLRANARAERPEQRPGDVDIDDGDATPSRRRFAFCGNRFETYELRWVGRADAPECPRRVLEAAAAIARGGVEIQVDPDGTFAAAAALGAFNDTSVQAWV